VLVSVAPFTGFADLEREWRALEATVPGLSFFQSWTWVGCLAEKRYPDPVLLRAEVDGTLVGLALFNRRRRRLHLTESGDAALDAPFVEHNAPLLSAAAGGDALAEMLRAAWQAGATRRLVLSGVPPAVLDAAGGAVLRWQERLAPRVLLEAVRRGGGDYLGTRSANARYQLRRSARAYARDGEVMLRRAEDVPHALDWLEGLIGLHEASWHARGKPGAFATPFLRQFHQALVARALPRGEVDLLRVTAGEAVVGYLYNFRLRGQVLAYQSGLDHATADAHRKPGLTCHAMAIEQALARGDSVYDFLAGADRYKRSLANAEVPLLWAELVPRWSALGLAARLARRWRRDKRGSHASVSSSRHGISSASGGGSGA
jgi:CelD/BcsL family acetyltransferase involved in cellulose biosynthesis